MILNEIKIQIAFISTVLLVSIILFGSLNAEAQDNVKDRWEGFLSGSKITNDTIVPNPDPNVDDATLISDYYLCSDKNFVHTNEVVAGGLPPVMRSLTIGQLEPQGSWDVVVLRDGSGTAFPQLQLTSPGAIRLFSLAFVGDNEIKVDGKTFMRIPGDESQCGMAGDPFLPQSPLQ